MDQFRTISKARLESLDYLVTEITEGRGESADLLATTNGESLIVEVKSRIEDEPVEDRLQQAAEGEIVSWKKDLGRQSPLARIVQKAVSQIRDSKQHGDELAVLWFYPDPKLGLTDAPKQMEATLLGIRWVLAQQLDDFKVWPCYLAARTDFHKYPDLDMVIIDSSEGSKLFLNPYSKRLKGVRETRLFRFFDREGAVVDLHRIRSGKECFVLFGDFDRGNDSAVLAELENRYPGARYRFVNMESIGGYTKFKET